MRSYFHFLVELQSTKSDIRLSTFNISYCAYFSCLSLLLCHIYFLSCSASMHARIIWFSIRRLSNPICVLRVPVRCISEKRYQDLYHCPAHPEHINCKNKLALYYSNTYIYFFQDYEKNTKSGL